MKFKNILLSVPFLFLSHGSNFSSSNNKTIKNMTKQEKLSFELDSYFLKYERSFENSVNFWMNAFTLDSTKSLVFDKSKMSVLDTIERPRNGRYHDVLDSVKDVRKSYDIHVTCGRRQKMVRATERAFNHLDYIIDTLKKNKLPTSLAVLPYIESEYLSNAHSKAAAKGIWQFRKGTARDYGLKVNYNVDERLDNKKSLSAFIKYMKDSYKKFGDKHALAVTSYNTGRYHKYYSDWENKNETEIIKDMKYWSGNYFPSFLAGIKILKNPCEYFPECDFCKKDFKSKK